MPDHFRFVALLGDASWCLGSLTFGFGVLIIPSPGFLRIGGNMSWIDQPRRLTAFSATVALIGVSLLGAPPATPQDQPPDSQLAATGTVSTPAPSISTPAQAISAPTTVDSASAPAVLPVLTPEQLGDTLMARQRYQAAI